MVSVLDPRLPSTYRAQVNSSTHMFRNTTLYKQVIPILRICVTYYYAHIWMPYIIYSRLNIYLHMIIIFFLLWIEYHPKHMLLITICINDLRHKKIWYQKSRFAKILWRTVGIRIISRLIKNSFTRMLSYLIFVTWCNQKEVYEIAINLIVIDWRFKQRQWSSERTSLRPIWSVQ